LVLHPDYVKALGISDDDVQYQTTDHSGNLVFNLLTHETWVEAELGLNNDVSAITPIDNSPASLLPAADTALLHSHDESSL
jgi:hypothetical protein